MDSYATYKLPYAGDSEPLMRRLGTRQRPVFLDSGAQRVPDRQFDLLTADPVAWVQLTAGASQCSEPGWAINDSDIFSIIRKLQHTFLADSTYPPPPADDLPFHGGVLGFLGYPALLGRTSLQPQDAYFGVYTWAVIVDHERRQSTLVCHPLCPPAVRAQLHTWLTTPCDDSLLPPAPFQLRIDFQRDLTRADYDAAFHAIKHYIQAGDCYQVNLTQRVTATCSGSSLAAYLRLRHSLPAPFSAYFGWDNGALLSLSPERFVRLVGRDVLTQPIKGTRPRHPDPMRDAALARELLASEKDRAENLMIVDLLRNDLGKVCETGTIQANQLFALHSYSNVHHLVSSVSARLAAGFDGLDLLQACYPGGSITGAPKLRAMDIIQELEPAPRRAYCGTVFYLGANGNLDSNITIRSLLREGDKLYCWAGGGIVDDSVCDAEYAECFDKIDRIISRLSE